MASNNIISLADYPRRKDPAADAHARMATTSDDDDDSFAAAVREVELRPATTVAGARAKFDTLCVYLDELEAGATMTAEGWASLNMLRGGIDAALAEFSARRTA